MKLYKLAFTAIGAAAGFVIGVLLAPRSGAESRAMASDAVNDAWDSAIDTYERGQQAVSEKFSTMRPNVDATTDELRAKVDLARERMDQLRDSLSATAVDEAATEAEAEAADATEAESAESVIEEAAAEIVVEAAEEAAEATEEAAEDKE